MSIDRQVLAPVVAALMAAGAMPLQAQAPTGGPALSPPIAGVPAAPAIAGSGAGFHDPRSAFKPLQEREGVVSWKLLASVTSRTERDRIVPVFPPAVRALDRQTVKVQGFMLPLGPGERQSHFLLSAVPTTCSFCIPAGPEGLVEVRASTPLKFTVEAITVQGRMAVLTNDKFGLFYRVVDAAPAP